MDDQKNFVSVPRKKAPVWVFSLAFFPLGLGGFILGLGNVVQGHHSLHWTAVPGVVLSSRLSESFLAPSQPDVRYRYSFDGSSYVSNRVWPGDILSYMPVTRRKASQVIVDRFPEETSVTVYVNPLDPSEVALIPGPGKAYRWVGVFAFFLLIGLWSPFAAWRAIRAK